MAATLASGAFSIPSPASAQPTILFVTQPPFGSDFASVNATFGNHLGTTGVGPRGGDLWIRYGDGQLRNLTQEAGFGVGAGQEISVREPSVHWSGTKALFSMVIGGTAPNDYSPVYWQIYEVSGLGEGEPVSIVKLPQPAGHNNVSPLYGTDDRVLFTSDLPRNRDPRTYPQLDEYESQPTVTGIWSMSADGTDLRILDHAPSGDFTPIIASDGRVVFTRWDHLQRDQQSNDGAETGYGAFNYLSETSEVELATSEEIFPEPRIRVPGSLEHGHTMNHFFLWEMNEDGTRLETLNHVGRHELSSYFDSSRDWLPELIAPEGRRTAERLFQPREDPLRPGRFFATNAPEFGTHAAGQIVILRGPETLNADDMQVRYVTHPATRFPVDDGDPVPSGHSGLYRNPTPLSDYTVIAVRSSESRYDSAAAGRLSSRYDFHLVRLVPGQPYWTPGARLLAEPIAKSISYWDNYSYQQLSYSGPLWELDPVEVRARPRPARRTATLPDIETQILEQELGGAGGVEELRSFLRRRSLALVVSRNVTRRADRQQEMNLAVDGGTASTVEPGATPTLVKYIQFLMGELVRGYASYREGRRAIAQPLRLNANPPLAGAPASSVALGADGSFAAFVPARRALTWQLLEGDGTPVVRERMWVTFAPGEMRVCANCHGINRVDVVLGEPPPTNPPQALRDLLAWWREAVRDGTRPAIFEVRAADDLRSVLILGESFGFGAQVFVGGAVEPWPAVVQRSARRLKLTGAAALDAAFPRGVATRIRVANPGGGEVETTFTRLAP